MLVDSSRFGLVAFGEAFAIDRRSEIITDRSFPRSVVKIIEETGAMVTVV